MAEYFYKPTRLNRQLVKHATRAHSGNYAKSADNPTLEEEFAFLFDNLNYYNIDIKDDMYDGLSMTKLHLSQGYYFFESILIVHCLKIEPNFNSRFWDEEHLVATARAKNSGIKSIRIRIGE